MTLTKEPKTKLTYRDYAKTPEDERWELIDGDLIMAAAPNTEHQMIQSDLGWHVKGFVMERDLGWVFYSAIDVVLSDYDTVQPDLVFVSKARADIITRANIRGAPDLVVEILSPSTARRDWRDKFDLYELHGVPEYWMADPEARVIWVFVLREGVVRGGGTVWGRRYARLAHSGGLRTGFVGGFSGMTIGVENNQNEPSGADSTWDRIMGAALAIPGVKVDRWNGFLRSQLAPYLRRLEPDSAGDRGQTRRRGHPA